MHYFQLLGWLACVAYSTVPAFWLMIHPFADRWREQRRSPYFVLLPAWMAMWAAFALCTRPWRVALVYHANWSWIAGLVLFTTGLSIHSQALKHFSAKQLGGVPELHRANRDQRLITTGIRSRVRHPVYLAYLCEMLGLSIGTGLAVCWALTAFAIATGAAMIGAEDTELEKRFGEEYRAYRSAVPAVFPRMSASRQL